MRKGKNVDIGRAFTSFLNDPEWIKKLLIGALLSLIPLVGGFILLGWALAIARNTYNGDDSRLPEWNDLGGYLVKGLTAWVGALIWTVPIIILVVCMFGSLFAVAESDAAAFVVIFFSFGVVFLSVIYAAIVLPVPIARYAVRGNFSSMLEFGQIFAEIRKGIKALVVALVIWIVASFIVAPLGILACFVGVYVTSALSYVMIAHAMGQAYRQIDDKGAMPPVQPRGSQPPPAPSQTAF